jgi:uncharacterized membrane protein
VSSTSGTRSRLVGVSERRRPDDTSAEVDDAYPPLRAQGIAALVLSLLGLGDSIYVTYIHYSNSVAACPSTGTIDCVKVLTSPQSMVFGVIPVPILGLAFFVAMTIVNLPPLWRSANPWIARVRLAMVVVGMGTVIYLVYTELFTIGSICLWCTGVHVITFLLLILVVGTYPAMSDRWRDWEAVSA